MRLFEVFEQTDPSDEDLFGPSESDKIRQAVLDELDNILMNYHEWPSLHKHHSIDKTKEEYASLQKVRDTFEGGGLIKGFRSLDLLSQNLIDHLDNELSFNHNIILGQAEAKYLQGQSNAQPFQNNYIREDEPSDTDLFGGKEASSDHAQKLGDLIYDYAEESSNLDDDLYDNRERKEIVAEIRLLFNVANLFRTTSIRIAMREFMKLSKHIRGDIRQMAHYEGMEWIDDYIKAYGQLTNENTDPSDDDLFGDDISPQWKIVKFIDEEIAFNESQIRILNMISHRRPNDDSLIDQRQKNIKRLSDYKDAFSRSLRDGLAIWSSDLVERDAFKNPYRTVALTLGANARASNINLYHIANGFNYKISEDTGPSDDDLFGDQNSLIRNRVIEAIKELQEQRRNRFYDILDSMGVSSVSDIDADDEANWDVLDDIEELNQHADIYERFIREFNTGLKQGLAYFAKSMSYALGGAHYEVAEIIEHVALGNFGTNLRDLTKQVLGLDIE